MEQVMSEESVNPVTIKCRICGGSLKNDHLSGVGYCEHCGNKWNLSDVIPEYKKYLRVIEKIRKASESYESAEKSAEAVQAMLLYKSAAAECSVFSDVTGAELHELCKKGAAECEKKKRYLNGRSYAEKGKFRKALTEYEKAEGYADAVVQAQVCRDKAAAERKKRIPYAIVIGMIIPAITSFFLREKADLPIAIVIPIFLILSAVFSYGVYLEGTISVITEILSFLSAVPLLIYMVLAYGLGYDPGLAAGVAAGVPIGIIILIAVLAEIKQ